MNPTQIGPMWGNEEEGEGVVVWQGTCSLCTLHSCGQNGAMASALYYLFHLLLGHFLCLFCFWFLFASRFAAGFIVSLNRRQSTNQRLAQLHMCVCVNHLCVCVGVGAEFVCLACAWQTNNTQKGKTNGNANAPLRLFFPLHAPLWGIICV